MVTGTSLAGNEDATVGASDAAGDGGISLDGGTSLAGNEGARAGVSDAGTRARLDVARLGATGNEGAT